MYHKYTINHTDRFDRQFYPLVVQEVDILQATIAKVVNRNRNDIVISFLKDHAIRTAFLQGNNEIVDMMISGSLSTLHIESLFDACRNNETFRDEFERFIRLQLGEV
jgi:hypothetical protein